MALFCSTVFGKNSLQETAFTQYVSVMASKEIIRFISSWFMILLFLLLGIISLPNNVEAGTGREVSYVGCMKRTLKTSFSRRAHGKNETSMSVQRCVQMCWYRRKKVAGIQAGRECYCSFSQSGLTSAPEKECKSRCTANCYQACGGPKALSVYKTGYTREPTFVIAKTAYLPAFIGCYDSRTALDILCPSRYKPLWTRRLTIPMCIYYCDAMYQTKFSTVAATDKCCCSTSVHGTRNTVLAWCDFHGKPCDGDKKQGCIGTQEKTFQWSTHQRDRIPNFKRWPKSTFTAGKWLKPNFKAGEKYLMADLATPIEVSAGDATLLGLMAKKRARQKIDEANKEESDDDKRTMVGADKRDPALSGTAVSAGILDVPKKTAMPAEVKGDEGSNTSIVAAVVVGFIVFLSALGFYLYSQKKRKEESKDDSDVSDEDSDDDDDDSKVRRRKKRKPKKKKKKKKKEKSRQNAANDDDDDDDDDDDADEKKQKAEAGSRRSLFTRNSGVNEDDNYDENAKLLY